MAFQSFHFIIFFLATLFFVRIVFASSNSAKKSFLLIASYYFYMCWDWRFAGLIFLLTIINFFVGPKVYRANTDFKKRSWLSVSLLLSLGILAYFKYANFFIDSLNSLLASFGLNNNVNLLNVVLPVGISFYTFQCISYTLDIYRGRTEPIQSLRDFAMFVAFFPQLVAGPIVRASHFLPQMKDGYQEEVEKPIESGLALMIRGYIKKVAIADVLGLHIVDPAFSTPGNFSPLFLVVALYAYSYQVYMDFSGYTDIARGVSRAMGYELQINFNRPYMATSIGNFWQRWHISMSSFFRDYLYFGLGGSRFGNVYVNLFITFVAIGLWHGAGWNFVVYGATHAAMVCWERWRRESRKEKGLPEVKLHGARLALQIFMVFNLISFSRVMFRAGSLDSAIIYMRAMLTGQGDSFALGILGGGALIIAILLHYTPLVWTYRWKDIFCGMPSMVQAFIIVAVIYANIVVSSRVAPFIYFQF